MSQDFAQSLISTYASEAVPPPEQFVDIANYKKQFTKNVLGQTGTLALTTQTIKIFNAFRQRSKGMLQKYGLSESDLDDLGESIQEGDYQSALAKIGSKLTNKLTDAGKTALQGVQDKLNELKNLKLEDVSPLSNLKETVQEINPISKESLNARYNALSQEGKDTLNEVLQDRIDRGLIQKGDMNSVSEIMSGVEDAENTTGFSSAQIVGDPDNLRIGSTAESFEPRFEQEIAPAAADDAAASSAVPVSEETAVNVASNAEQVATKATEAAESLKDLSEAGTALDLDPITTGVGLLLGIGSSLLGLEIKAHKEKFISPPEILRNYQVGTDT